MSLAMHLHYQRAAKELEHVLVGIAKAIGFDSSNVTTPDEVRVAVEEYVQVHNDAMEALAYARNELHDARAIIEDLSGRLDRRAAELPVPPQPSLPAPQSTYGIRPHRPMTVVEAERAREWAGLR